MSCRDCGQPIDKFAAEMRARLAARFEPGEPIKLPVRCTECSWKAITKLSTGGPPATDVRSGTGPETEEK